MCPFIGCLGGVSRQSSAGRFWMAKTTPFFCKTHERELWKEDGRRPPTCWQHSKSVLGQISLGNRNSWRLLSHPRPLYPLALESMVGLQIRPPLSGNLGYTHSIIVLAPLPAQTVRVKIVWVVLDSFKSNANVSPPGSAARRKARMYLHFAAPRVTEKSRCMCSWHSVSPFVSPFSPPPHLSSHLSSFPSTFLFLTSLSLSSLPIFSFPKV